MFTGLIEDVGSISLRRRTPDGWKLRVRTALPLAEIAIGESIAINGACLTVESVDAAAGDIEFHTLAETLARTNLVDAQPGAEVNIERAMSANGRFGGHIVLGHVDATSAIRSVSRNADDIAISVGLPEDMASLVIPKGSITINGISLTVATLESSSFSVRIIPHTLHGTNLRTASAGDVVNLEADVIGKYVARLLGQRTGSSVSMDTLGQAGFL